MVDITAFPIVTKEFDPAAFAGADGADGKEVEVQVTATDIEWRYVGDVTWTQLIALSALEGPQGIQGIQGPQGDIGNTGDIGDPGADGTEIELQVVNGSLEWRYVGDATWTVLDYTADLTFTTLTGVTVVDVRETVQSITSGSIDANLGSIVNMTLSANATLALTNFDSGMSMTVHITGGDTYTVTWPTMTWVGGSAPALTAADVIEFWKVGSTLYGAYVGAV